MKVILTFLLLIMSNIIYAQYKDFVEFNSEMEVLYNPTTTFGQELVFANKHSGMSYLLDYRYLAKIETKVYIGGNINTQNVYRSDSKVLPIGRTENG